MRNGDMKAERRREKCFFLLSIVNRGRAGIIISDLFRREVKSKSAQKRHGDVASSQFSGGKRGEKKIEKKNTLDMSVTHDKLYLELL
jgi:hypothetical protein